MLSTLINKDKLPKELSYPVQTRDIEQGLNTDGLQLRYVYWATKKEKQKHRQKYFWVTIEILKLQVLSREYEKLVGCLKDGPPEYLPVGQYLTIYSVPPKLRNGIRFELRTRILPALKNWQSLKNRGHEALVYYQTFGEGNSNRGGLYIEVDRYTPKKRVIYHDINFNIDKEVKEIYL